jgi:hypothetical protein
VEKMVSDLFERARKDGEDAAQVMREHDESYVDGMPSPTNRSSSSKASSRRRRG